MFAGFLSSAIDQISLLRVTDAVDICIVAVIVYFVLRFIRDSHTSRLLKGVIMIILAVQVVYMFNLHVTSYIVSKCAQIGVIALVVIFQPELRRALDQEMCIRDSLKGPLLQLLVNLVLRQPAQVNQFNISGIMRGDILHNVSVFVRLGQAYAQTFAPFELLLNTLF